MNVYRSVSREQVETYLYKLTYELLIGVVPVSYTHLQKTPPERKASTSGGAQEQNGRNERWNFLRSDFRKNS